jgi:hypothetical protein
MKLIIHYVYNSISPYVPIPVDDWPEGGRHSNWESSQTDDLYHCRPFSMHALIASGYHSLSQVDRAGL